MDYTDEFFYRILSDLLAGGFYYVKWSARFKGTQIIANAIEVSNDPAMIELLAHYKVWYYDSTERSCDYAANHLMDDLKAEVPDELAKKYLFLQVRFSLPNANEPDNGILVIDKERELSNLPENLKYLLQVKCNLSDHKNLTLLLENIDPQTLFLYAGSYAGANEPVKPIWHLSEFRGWEVEWLDEYTIW